MKQKPSDMNVSKLYSNTVPAKYLTKDVHCTPKLSLYISNIARIKAYGLHRPYEQLKFQTFFPSMFTEVEAAYVPTRFHRQYTLT